MLPQLYKQTKTGAIQTYIVTTSGDTITVQQGQVEGKLQSYLTTCTGKNTGRANETTPEQQAILEAQSKHKKKLDSGYTIDPSGKITIELPMKVKVYQDHIKNIPEKVLYSRKLNGVNGEFRLTGSGLILLSRGGKQYPMLEHLKQPITELLHTLGTTEISGELYIHGEFLQDITGAVKKFKEAITPRVEFHVFDLPTIGGSFTERLNKMNTTDYGHNKIHHIEFVDSSTVDIETFHTKAVAAGYEGIVIHDPEGLYEYNTRSSHVWKYKKALDAEYKIIDYSIDKNGHPVLLCLVDHTKPLTKDNSFNVSPKGTSVERKAIVAHIDDYLGEWYKVEYETVSKVNKPQKPVGIGLRLCNNKGEPLE